MTVTATRYDIREVAVLELAEGDRLSLARLQQTLQHERFPHAPPDPLELVERRLRHRPSTMQARDWLATLDSEVIGMGHVARWLGDGNPHWREAWIGVRPDHRRQGIASRLLRQIVDAWRSEGSSGPLTGVSLVVHCDGAHEEPAHQRRGGASAPQRDRSSREARRRVAIHQSEGSTP